MKKKTQQLSLFGADSPNWRQIARTMRDDTIEGGFKYIKSRQNVTPKPDKSVFDADNYALHDDMQAALNGIYHDEREHKGVITNKFILVSSKKLYDENSKGKTIATHKFTEHDIRLSMRFKREKGDAIVASMFPVWRAVLMSKDNDTQRVDINFDTFADMLAGIEDREKEIWKNDKNEGKKFKFATYKKNADVYVRMPDGQIATYDLTLLQQYATAAKFIGATALEYTPKAKGLTRIGAIGDDGEIVLMNKTAVKSGSGMINAYGAEKDTPHCAGVIDLYGDIELYQGKSSQPSNSPAVEKKNKKSNSPLENLERIFSNRKLLTNFLLEARGTDRDSKTILGHKFVPGYTSHNFTLDIFAAVAGDWIMSTENEEFHGKDDKNVMQPSIIIRVTKNPKSGGWTFWQDFSLTVDELLAVSEMIHITKQEFLETLAENSTAVETAKKILAPDYTRYEMNRVNLTRKKQNIGDFVTFWAGGLPGGHTGVVTDFDISQGAYEISVGNILYWIRFDGAVYNGGSNTIAEGKIRNEKWYPQFAQNVKKSVSTYNDASRRKGQIGEFIQIKQYLNLRGGLIVGYAADDKYQYKDITGKLDEIGRHYCTVLHRGHTDWEKYDEAFSTATWYKDFKKAAEEKAAEKKDKPVGKPKFEKGNYARFNDNHWIVEILGVDRYENGEFVYSVKGGGYDKITDVKESSLIDVETTDNYEEANSKLAYALRAHDNRTGSDSYSYYDTKEEAMKHESWGDNRVIHSFFYAGEVTLYECLDSRAGHCWQEKGEIEWRRKDHIIKTDVKLVKKIPGNQQVTPEDDKAKRIRIAKAKAKAALALLELVKLRGINGVTATAAPQQTVELFDDVRELFDKHWDAERGTYVYTDFDGDEWYKNKQGHFCLLNGTY